MNIIMNQVALKEKILDIEAELALLKKTLQKEPDLDVDEANWQKVRSEIKKTLVSIFCAS